MVALGKLSGRKVKVWWFDPRTGAAKPAGECEPRGGLEFTPPTSGVGQDWVLVLDDISRRFRAPGAAAFSTRGEGAPVDPGPAIRRKPTGGAREARARHE